MMDRDIKEAGELYAKYVMASTEERLHFGATLEQAAILLLNVKLSEDKISLHDSEEIYRRVERNYLMEKLAIDFLSLVEHMSHTKQYDLSPKIKVYTYLAFDLMFEVVKKKPHRKLIPCLAHRLYYLMYETDKQLFEEGSILFQECINHESTYLENLKSSNSPWYVVAR